VRAVPPGDVYETFDTVSGRSVGSGGERSAYVVVLLAVVAVVAALGWFVATERLPSGATDVVREARVEPNRLLGVLALFVVAYVVVLYLTATLFDAGISVEGRLLVPIQVMGAVLVVGLGYRAAARVGATAIAVGIAIVVVVLCAWPWRQIALYSASGHDVVFVPPRWDRMPGERNDEFHSELVDLGRILRKERGYLALYAHPPEEFATRAEVARTMQLEEVGNFADGALYRVIGLRPGVA